jgi:23S rRNA pseudouridine2604 synthase
MEEAVFPMRINRYLAWKKYCTRRQADVLIRDGKVSINGKPAMIGDKVRHIDTVEVRDWPKKYRYVAYYKPRGIITHSPQGEEKAIADVVKLPGVFPVGRLDKDSFGLIILTDDGRVTDALLNPAHEHEKEYEVTCLNELPRYFKGKMEHGVDIGGYTTKPCTVEMLDGKRFRIALTEGKKRQIRRMCGALGQSAEELKRIRIMNIRLGDLKPGKHRTIKGAELDAFLGALGLA